MKIAHISLMVACLTGCQLSKPFSADELEGYLAHHDLEQEINHSVYNRCDAKAARRVYLHYRKHTMDKARGVLWLLVSSAYGDRQSQNEVARLVGEDGAFSRKAAELIRGVCYSGSERDIGLCAMAMQIADVLDARGAGLSGSALAELLAKEVGPESSWIQSPWHAFYMSQECLRDAEWRAVAVGDVKLARRVCGYYNLFSFDAGRARLWRLVVAALSPAEGDGRIIEPESLDCADLQDIHFSDSEVQWSAKAIRDVAVEAIKSNDGDVRALIPVIRETLRKVSKRLSRVVEVDRNCLDADPTGVKWWREAESEPLSEEHP